MSLSPKQFAYPLVWLEKKRRPGTSFLDVAAKQSDFVPSLRLPYRGRYSEGTIFDAAGRVYGYVGEVNVFRFSRQGLLSGVLEFAFIPVLVFQVFRPFIYYGPNLRTVEELCLEEYKSRLKSNLVSTFEADSSLRGINFDKCSTFADCINEVDDWRFFGGSKDSDGHDLSDIQR